VRGTLGVPLNEEWPELLPEFGGEHAFEVLECRASKAAVLAVQTAEGDVEGWLGESATTT
jgi:hypothetical protein